MDAKSVNATLETRISKKSGKAYQCIVIKLTDTYDKVVFLEPAELELLKKVQPVTTEPTFPDFM